MDEALRRCFDEIANEISPQLSLPARVRARARRRAAATGAFAITGLVVVLAITVAGVREIVRTSVADPPVVSGSDGLSATWKGLEGTIVFVSDEDLRATAVDPSTLETTVVFQRAFRMPVAWSHDGSRLLEWDDGHLYVMDASGSRTRLPGEEVPYGGSWSPDDSEIVFAAAPSAQGAPDFTLFVASADGGGAHRLLPDGAGSGSLLFPAWSPDGRSIVFLATDDGTPGAALMIADAGGTATRALVPDHRVGTGPVVWSPDGTSIAFAGMDERSGIFTVDVGTGVVSEVTAVGGATSPSWSSDGSRLAFRQATGHGDELFLVDRDGSGLRRVGVALFKDTPVVWVPEGG